MNEQLTNLVLVQEIEKRPVIYNYQLRNCSRKDVIESAWNEVGKAVDMTVSECKVRWKNLRTVFARHIKSKKTGFRKRPYYLYQAMQFAIPYIKVFNFESGKKSNRLREEREEPFEDIEIKEENTSFQYPDSDSNGVYHNQQQSVSPPDIPTSALMCQKEQSSVNDNEHTSKLYNKSLAPITSDEWGANHYETNKTKKTTSPANVGSSRPKALRMFLLSMLPDLESMTENQVREFKRRCLQIIDEIVSPT